MNKERLMTVLIQPHVSEKAANVAEKANQYVFRVRDDASKAEALSRRCGLHLTNLRRLSRTRSVWSTLRIRNLPSSALKQGVDAPAIINTHKPSQTEDNSRQAIQTDATMRVTASTNPPKVTQYIDTLRTVIRSSATLRIEGMLDRYSSMTFLS